MALHHKNINIKNSLIDGNGLFARRDLKKGETIAIIRGRVVDFIVVDTKTSLSGPNWIGIGKNKWVDPYHTFENINHSCDPNAGIKGTKTVVARKNIKKDEEITIDYSITEADILWKLDKKCRCGSHFCRGIIRSIQFLPLKIFKSYLPYISKYFQQAYYKHNKIS